MKSAGFALLVIGFLAGAYSTSLDVESVNWVLFVVAVLLAIAGTRLVKQADSAHAQSATVLETTAMNFTIPSTTWFATCSR